MNIFIGLKQHFDKQMAFFHQTIKTDCSSGIVELMDQHFIFEAKLISQGEPSILENDKNGTPVEEIVSFKRLLHLEYVKGIKDIVDKLIG